MSKYSPLGSFLADNGADQISMRFDEIEDILKFKLPKSKIYPAWWSNNPSNNPMTSVWLEAGYHTEQVDIAGQRLVFRRTYISTEMEPRRPVEAVPPLVMPAEIAAYKEASVSAAPSLRRVHPAFGALRGWLGLSAAIDLTQPSDPEWGRSND